MGMKRDDENVTLGVKFDEENTEMTDPMIALGRPRCEKNMEMTEKMTLGMKIDEETEEMIAHGMSLAERNLEKIEAPIAGMKFDEDANSASTMMKLAAVSRRTARYLPQKVVGYLSVDKLLINVEDFFDGRWD